MSEENRIRDEVARGIILFIAGAIENWENATMKDLLKMMSDTEDQGLRLLLFKCISANCDVNQLNREPLPFGKRIKTIDVKTNDDATVGVITVTFEDDYKMYYLVKMVNGTWKLWVEPTLEEAMNQMNMSPTATTTGTSRRPPRRQAPFLP